MPIGQTHSFKNREEETVLQSPRTQSDGASFQTQVSVTLRSEAQSTMFLLYVAASCTAFRRKKLPFSLNLPLQPDCGHP